MCEIILQILKHNFLRFCLTEVASAWYMSSWRKCQLLALLENTGTTSERRFGVQVDNKLSWSDHAANVAKSFASKLSLLRRMRFLPQKQLEDFYTKVILPSVTYGLTVWGSCNKTHLNNLEKLRARAGWIVHGLPWDTSTEDVLMRIGWDCLETMYVQRVINGVCLQLFKRLHHGT